MKVGTLFRYNPRHSDGEGFGSDPEQAQEMQGTSGRTESTRVIDSRVVFA
jgi:hypothetical protein